MPTETETQVATAATNHAAAAGKQANAAETIANQGSRNQESVARIATADERTAEALTSQAQSVGNMSSMIETMVGVDQTKADQRDRTMLLCACLEVRRQAISTTTRDTILNDIVRDTLYLFEQLWPTVKA